MENQGWIKLYRKVKDHWLWKQDRVFSEFEAWIDILLSVNHAPAKISVGGQLIEVNEGQLLTSIAKLSDNFKWSRKKVSRFLDGLEHDQMLSQERTSKYTLLTVMNWAFYQQLTADEEHQKHIKSTTEAHQKNIRGTSEAHQKNTNKNVKNDKNDKNEEKDNPPTPLPADWHNRFSPALSSKVDEWLAYKAEKRQSYKPQGLKAFIAKVERMAADYGDDAVAGVISESMAANYQGIVWDWLNKKLPKHPQENFKSQERDLNYLIDNEEI